MAVRFGQRFRKEHDSLKAPSRLGTATLHLAPVCYCAERPGYRTQRKHEREGIVEERESAVAFIPTGRALVFGVDGEGDPASLGSHPERTLPGGEKELATEAEPLNTPVYSQTPKAKGRYLVTFESPCDLGRNTVIGERCRADGIVAEDLRRLIYRHGNERLRAAGLMVLPRELRQILVQREDATVEVGSPMSTRNRLFHPGRKRHRATSSTATRTRRVGPCATIPFGANA